MIRDIDVMKTFALSGVLPFTRFFFKESTGQRFIVGRHHAIIADALDRVVRGECKRLMINIAPRYSKTELAVKNFIAYGLAVNPRAKFIHLSYSDDLVRLNSEGVQQIMREPIYQRLFGTHPEGVGTKMWTTPEGGGMYAVSSSGQVTGFGAGLVDSSEPMEDDELGRVVDFIGACRSFGGAIIIDDPIKPDDALSTTVRGKVNQKFDTTIRNRVNSRHTPIIIIMQRLHEDDLCGHLLSLEGDEWEVVSLPTIQYDAEGNASALWEHKHTLEELYTLREKNPWVFDTQYMQNPKPLEGLMYSQGFREWEAIPTAKRKQRKAYIDTADTGADYLCCIIYDETDVACYVQHVIYTQKPMEVTEPIVAKALHDYGVEVCIVEGNNGGRGFSRAVESQTRALGNYRTHIKAFHQRESKHTRIFTHSSSVQNTIYMPKDWQYQYVPFYNAVTGYLRAGTNAHDDAPDALTGVWEHRSRDSTITDEELLRHIL